ncbi:MAG: hypothetical protein AAB553_04885 [Patescibacteria group bacterium]
MIEEKPDRSIFFSERDRKTSLFKRHLLNATTIYSIQDNPQRIEYATNLLLAYRMDSNFGKDPEQAIFALAIADRLMRRPDERVKKRLAGILKLIAVGKTDQGDYTTQSGFVDTLATNDDEEKSYHPERVHEVTWREQAYTDEEYTTQFIDQEGTEEAREALKNWGQTSLLHTVRDNLGITPENEDLPRIVVLIKESRQIDNEMDGGAYYLPRSHRIVLPRNYEDYVEHEYAHSQSLSIQVGHNGVLFSGLDEAFTESVIREPVIYLNQLAVLKILQNRIPEMKTYLRAAYRGNKQAKQQVISSLIATYGFDGFLAIATMDAIVNPAKTNSVERTVYTPAKEVQDLLEDQEDVKYIVF